MSDETTKNQEIREKILVSYGTDIKNQTGEKSSLTRPLFMPLIDANMHIRSNRCIPLQLLWGKHKTWIGKDRDFITGVLLTEVKLSIKNFLHKDVFIFKSWDSGLEDKVKEKLGGKNEDKSEISKTEARERALQANVVQVMTDSIFDFINIFGFLEYNISEAFYGEEEQIAQHSTIDIAHLYKGNVEALCMSLIKKEMNFKKIVKWDETKKDYEFLSVLGRQAGAVGSGQQKKWEDKEHNDGEAKKFKEWDYSDVMSLKEIKNAILEQIKSEISFVFMKVETSKVENGKAVKTEEYVPANDFGYVYSKIFRIIFAHVCSLAKRLHRLQRLAADRQTAFKYFYLTTKHYYESALYEKDTKRFYISVPAACDMFYAHYWGECGLPLYLPWKNEWYYINDLMNYTITSTKPHGKTGEEPRISISFDVHDWDTEEHSNQYHNYINDKGRSSRTVSQVTTKNFSTITKEELKTQLEAYKNYLKLYAEGKDPKKFSGQFFFHFDDIPGFSRYLKKGKKATAGKFLRLCIKVPELIAAEKLKKDCLNRMSVADRRKLLKNYSEITLILPRQSNLTAETIADDYRIFLKDETLKNNGMVLSDDARDAFFKAEALSARYFIRITVCEGDGKKIGGTEIKKLTFYRRKTDFADSPAHQPLKAGLANRHPADAAPQPPKDNALKEDRKQDESSGQVEHNTFNALLAEYLADLMDKLFILKKDNLISDMKQFNLFLKELESKEIIPANPEAAISLLQKEQEKKAELRLLMADNSVFILDGLGDQIKYNLFECKLSILDFINACPENEKTDLVETYNAMLKENIESKLEKGEIHLHFVNKTPGNEREKFEGYWQQINQTEAAALTIPF